MPEPDWEYMEELAVQIARLVKSRQGLYGNSWAKRGGTGAFHQLARKWDRIEDQCEGLGFDLFEAVRVGQRANGVYDDLLDLIGYSLLVLERFSHVTDETEERDET